MILQWKYFCEITKLSLRNRLNDKIEQVYLSTLNIIIILIHTSMSYNDYWPNLYFNVTRIGFKNLKQNALLSYDETDRHKDKKVVFE